MSRNLQLAEHFLEMDIEAFIREIADHDISALDIKPDVKVLRLGKCDIKLK